MYVCPRCDRQLTIPAHYMSVCFCPCGWAGTVFSGGKKCDDKLFVEKIDAFLKTSPMKKQNDKSVMSANDVSETKTVSTQKEITTHQDLKVGTNFE